MYAKICHIYLSIKVMLKRGYQQLFLDLLHPQADLAKFDYYQNLNGKNINSLIFLANYFIYV